MVARRQRQQRQIKLTESGIPDLASMPGVDTSCSEDPAMFWGPNWKEDLEKALAQADAGEGTFFDSTGAFRTFLNQQ
jgi:hypothetical protein